MNRLKVMFLILFIGSGAELYAENRVENPPERTTIAVMNFQTNNCSPAVGRALADLLGGKIFNSRHFILLERSQIAQVLKEKRFVTRQSIEKEYAAELGRALDVKKIIVGSVSKFDTYTVEIRIVDVQKRTVDLSLSRDADDMADLKEMVNMLHQRIDHYYSGYKALSGSHDLMVTPSFVYALGDFCSNARKGLGVRTEVSFNTIIDEKFPLSVSVGLYRMLPEQDYIQSFYMLPLEVHLAYRYDLTETFRWLPSIGAGYLFSRVVQDRYAYRVSGEYHYQTVYYYNPLIAVRSEFNFKISHGYYITCVPYYTHFFETGRSNGIIGLDFGLRILF